MCVEGLEMPEYQVAAKLDAFRSQADNFVCSSFPTMANFGPHGSVIHNIPDEENSLIVKEGDMFLTDSGGQYLFVMFAALCVSSFLPPHLPVLHGMTDVLSQRWNH